MLARRGFLSRRASKHFEYGWKQKKIKMKVRVLYNACSFCLSFFLGGCI
jgi:hypothetical protein